MVAIIIDRIRLKREDSVICSSALHSETIKSRPFRWISLEKIEILPLDCKTNSLMTGLACQTASKCKGLESSILVKILGGTLVRKRSRVIEYQRQEINLQIIYRIITSLSLHSIKWVKTATVYYLLQQEVAQICRLSSRIRNLTINIRCLTKKTCKYNSQL